MAAVAGMIVAIGAGIWWVITNHGETSALYAAPAHLAVEWRGKYHGRMTLPAQVHWCPVTRIGWLEAVSGDSGFAIVLYEREALSTGPHPVVTADVAVSAPRPGATAAMRWMRLEEDTALAGFRSQSGMVQLAIARGLVSGDITAHMRAPTGSDTLVIKGVFRDVPVVTTAVGCT